MIESFILLIIATYIIRKCSLSFDIAANYLTRGLGEGVKGPTINAIASSLPELLTSSLFLFYFKDITGFSAGYGTIIGSSAFNIALIPVISYMYIYIKKGKDTVFDINKNIVKQDAFFLLGSMLLLSLGFFFGLNFFTSLLLILFYLLYIFYVVNTRASKKEDGTVFFKKFIKNHKLELKDKIIFTESGGVLYSIYNVRLFRILFKGEVNNVTSTLVALISILIIGGSCYLLVIATEDISHILGINLFFGAFIIAAIASSVPDTIFSVQDANNNKFIDSFSNAYGSNIFDICIGIGLPLLVYNVIYGPIYMNMPIERIGWVGDYILDGNLFIWSLIILFVFTILVSIIYYKYTLKIKSAFLLLLLYLLFILTLLVF